MKSKFYLWGAMSTLVLTIALTIGCNDEFTGTSEICPMVISTEPINLAIDVPLDQEISVTFNKIMDPATINAVSFFILQGNTEIDGELTYNGTIPTLNFIPTSLLLPGTTYTGTVTTDARDNDGNALQEDYVWTFSTREQVIVDCPTVVDLGKAGNYVIFAESGISATGVISIVGDMGVNPVTSTSVVGFGLILPAGGAYSSSSLVNGHIYAPDYAPPTPANVVTATNDMHTAYTTANGLVMPAPVTEFMAGNLNGQTLYPGIYKWSSGVLITDGITLDGRGDDCATFIFQIAQNLTIANGTIITLTNGAQAKNIFWVVAGSGTVIGTTVDFSGNILCKTLISVNTGSKVTGRLLAQTAVTLSGSTIIKSN